MAPSSRRPRLELAFGVAALALASTATIAFVATGDPDPAPNPGLARVAPAVPESDDVVELTAGLDPDQIALSVTATGTVLPATAAVYEVHVRVANTGQPPVEVTADRFSLETTDGRPLSPTAPAGPALPEGELLSGTAIDGWLAFEVPGGLEGLLLRFASPAGDSVVLPL